jgi:N-acyl homoserine lactone hydrolase
MLERSEELFLTHLHLDHVSGMRDVPNDAIVYTGPGESTERGFMNAFVHGPTDAALEGKGDLREWRFAPDPDSGFAGVVDVFGDGSVPSTEYVPGSTPFSHSHAAQRGEPRAPEGVRRAPPADRRPARAPVAPEERGCYDAAMTL